MELTVTTFLSVDGVAQGPGGPEEDRTGGFDRGGWVVPYADEGFNRFVTEMFDRVEAFLLGRRTYEIFASHWPRVTDPGDPVATRLNSLPKYVASHTLSKVDWNNSTLLHGEVADAVAKLKEQPGGELQVHGSGALVRYLMQHDLIDEYRLLTFPVILGDGVRFFADKGLPTGLGLAESRTTESGVAINVYRPTGRATFGSFLLPD